MDIKLGNASPAGTLSNLAPHAFTFRGIECSSMEGLLQRESDEYQQLLDEAYSALFDQNEKARKALLATNQATLTHSIGRRKTNETVLTQQEFCSRLTSIRAKIISDQFVEY